MTDTLAMSLQAIGRSKLRSFLTTLGIIIGVASVVAMVHLGQSATRSVTEGIAAIGSNLLFVLPGTSRHGPGGARAAAEPFDPEDVAALEREIPGVRVIGVAKGLTRKAGLETLIDGASGREIVLPPTSPALHLIQHIRDEAHRFAITGHRQRRGKQRTSSELDGIDGVGPARRRALIQHFGGIRGVRGASVEELTKVRGVSRTLAEQINGALHSH
jgi:hypothetical protein